MGVVRSIGDGLVNLVANLGTSRDKAAASFYGTPCLSERELVDAYRGAWLPQKIVNVPALDSCRNWRQWQADSEEISAIEAEETRLGLATKMLSAMKKARLFGGAGIYIGTGDSNPEEPLNVERIGKGGVKHLVVLTRRNLQAGEIDRDPESDTYGLPSRYTITGNNGQVDVHPSRIVRLVGAEHPDPELSTGTMQGWGDSILQATFEAVRNADSTAANIAALVFEAKIDVFKIPNFMAGLSGDKDYEAQVIKRFGLAAQMKAINGALVIDAEEGYEQKSAQFTSLADLLFAFMQLVSGASDIPVTRLLGQSPGGLNSTGDSDIRNYYDRIKAMQELELTPALAILDECLVRSALGSRPKEVFYNWRSLWQTTEKERSEIGKTTAETIKLVNETKLIPEEVMSKVAQNMLTESGVAPGLEAEMDEYELENPEGEEEEALASVTIVPTEGAQAEVVPVGDAQPRSLYVRRDVVNVSDIAAWARAQGIEDLADDLHVTVVYSRSPFDWIKAGNAKEWGENGKDQLIVPEGGPRAVEPLGNMSAVLMFASTQLSWRHEDIVRAGASHDYPDYQPHISLTKAPIDLSKVEPYRGRIVLGPEIFEEIED